MVLSARIKEDSKVCPGYQFAYFWGCKKHSTYLHIWGTCPVAQTYWVEIFTILFDKWSNTWSMDITIKLPKITPWADQEPVLPPLFHHDCSKADNNQSLGLPTLCGTTTKYRVSQVMIHFRIKCPGTPTFGNPGSTGTYPQILTQPFWTLNQNHYSSMSSWDCCGRRPWTQPLSFLFLFSLPSFLITGCFLHNFSTLHGPCYPLVYHCGGPSKCSFCFL